MRETAVGVGGGGGGWMLKLPKTSGGCKIATGYTRPWMQWLPNRPRTRSAEVFWVAGITFWSPFQNELRLGGVMVSAGTGEELGPSLARALFFPAFVNGLLQSLSIISLFLSKSGVSNMLRTWVSFKSIAKEP